MNLKKGSTGEIVIEDIAFGGRGVGRYEGMVVFVNGVMKGEKVEVEFLSFKKGFSEAKLVRIVEKAPRRLQARCPYFGTCGGCNYQYMPYEDQLAVKQNNVLAAFERIGKFKNPPMEAIVGSDEEYYYRNKMEFSFGFDEKMNFTLGMHVPGRRYDIMDLKECYLQSPESVKIVNLTRDLMRNADLEPFHYSTGEGFLKHLVIRDGKKTGELMVVLVTSDAVPENFPKILDDFVKLLKNMATSIYWSKTISKRGVPRMVEDKLLYGKETLSEKMLDDLHFEIMPRAFFQVNTLQAEKLYSRILDFARGKEHELVFDLFCGTGTIGIALAKHVGRVLGVELNEEAVKTAEQNARDNGIENISFFQGDVAEVLQDVKERPSLIVLDPPRAGLTPKMLEMVGDFKAPEIVYVSCNPATQARDCQMLEQAYAYKIQKLQPVDMFPQTYHVENIAHLVL